MSGGSGVMVHTAMLGLAGLHLDGRWLLARSVFVELTLAARVKRRGILAGLQRLGSVLRGCSVS